MKRIYAVLGPAVLCVSLVAVLMASEWTPLAVVDDPLVRMPGTQPGLGVQLEGPNRCLNCHAGYDQTVEPGFNWMGSMMAQAARDPIFWACMTVAAQDSVHVLGNPNATDLCLRCHFPGGWMAGRSDPTNASLMTGIDYDSISCDFCHQMWDPFCTQTYDGSREGADWVGYWDEADNTGPGSGTLSQTSADDTLAEDNQVLRPAVKLMSGGNFFVGDAPRYPNTYTEAAGGQFYVSNGGQKRAGFADAAARHKMLYSRYHKSKYFCGTCHDVSNPALGNLLKPLPDQSGGTDLISEQYSAFRYFHVERTFSEFMLSAYGRQGGADTNDDFRLQGAPTVLRAAKCQDCHMRDVRGLGADKNGVPIRPDGSTEHPNSGQPVHDMTGGNLWISYILASLDPDGPVPDARNVEILDRGPNVLTLDLSAGETPVQNGAALKDGADRARLQLRLAATLKDLAYNPVTGKVSLKVQNNTGHKLISGFPEGRRMFLNIRAYSGEQLIGEVNPYDDSVGTLKGLPKSASAPPLGPGEQYVDTLVYEVHPKSSITGEDETFHFVLADGRYKDNRIPPKGFDIASAPTRISQPVWHGADAPDYFTATEYAGGYDEIEVTLATGADHIEASLYYQGTSREYIEFLRDEINGTATTLPEAAYIVQTDPWFSQLKEWGNTIWDLWHHNHGLDGSGARVAGIVPFEMAEAEIDVQVPDPIEIAASLDWDWVYQNAPESTGGGHRSVLTLSVVNDPNGNAGYGATVEALSGSGGVVTVEATADPMVWLAVGGQAAADPVGDVQLVATVIGLDAGGAGTAEATVSVRKLGDLDGSGAVDTSDKLILNQHLNGLSDGSNTRECDLSADGVVDTSDKLIINRILNGIAVP